MKLFRVSNLICQAIVITGFLSSCENKHHGILDETKELNTESNDETARINSTSYIMRDGDNNLVYTTDGRTRLAKIKGKTCEWKFSYGDGATQNILALKYCNKSKGNSDSQHFTLNEQGLCVTSLLDHTYIYEYNASGQLTKCYNKIHPNYRQEFTYETNPSLKQKSLDKVTFYDENNFKYKEITYGYVAGVPDLHKTNLDIPSLGACKYLPIFGIFNKDLVDYTSTITFFSDGTWDQKQLKYEYVMDANGRVKKLTIKKPGSNEVVSVAERNYSNYPTGLEATRH